MSSKLANYLDLHLEYDEDDKLFTRLYDKRDDFDFPIVNVPYLSGAPQGGVWCYVPCAKFTCLLCAM